MFMKVTRRATAPVLELPGVRPEDVKISIENQALTIRGEKKQVAEENSERWHRYERTRRRPVTACCHCAAQVREVQATRDSGSRG